MLVFNFKMVAPHPGSACVGNEAPVEGASAARCITLSRLIGLVFCVVAKTARGSLTGALMVRFNFYAHRVPGLAPQIARISIRVRAGRRPLICRLRGCPAREMRYSRSAQQWLEFFCQSRFVRLRVSGQGKAQQATGLVPKKRLHAAVRCRARPVAGGVQRGRADHRG